MMEGAAWRKRRGGSGVAEAGLSGEGVRSPMASDDLSLFLTVLQEQFGGKAGNKALRDRLGWSADTDRYWQAHSRAIDSGQVVSGRGKGGSVLLISVDEESTSEAENADSGQDFAGPTGGIVRVRERDLYSGAFRVIESNWVKSANYDDHRAEITASKGRAATGGKWTRPDISIIATKAYPFLPNRIFDIITFEIKPNGQTTVEGVFEALSHQHFANRAYVIFQLDDTVVAENFAEKMKDADRILGIARKHGVGVIVATSIGDWESWDELVPAKRVSPDPEQANRFIASSFSKESLDQLIKWHK